MYEKKDGISIHEEGGKYCYGRKYYYWENENTKILWYYHGGRRGYLWYRWHVFKQRLAHATLNRKLGAGPARVNLEQFCDYCRAGVEIFSDLEWALLYTVVVEDVGGAGGGVAPGAARYQSRAGAPPAAGAGGALLLGPGQNVGADVQPLDDSLLHLLLGCWVGEEGRVPTGPPGVVRGSAEGARGFHQLLCSGSFLLAGTEWQH